MTQGGGSVPSRERVHGLRAPRTAARESLPRAIFTPWGSLAGSFPVPNCCDQTFINLTRKRKSGKSKSAAASEAGWAGLGWAGSGTAQGGLWPEEAEDREPRAVTCCPSHLALQGSPQGCFG